MDDELRTERVLACLLLLLIGLGFTRQYPQDPHEPWLIPLDELTPVDADLGENEPRQWRDLLHGGRMDVNQVTAEDLQAIPGVGPSLAQNIVDYREAHGPFIRLENLQSVRGIGARTLERIRRFLGVSLHLDAGQPVAPSP